MGKVDKPRLTLIIILGWCICFPLLGWTATRPPNLIPNPEFGGPLEPTGLPPAWHRLEARIPGAKPSRIFLYRVANHSGQLLALEAGEERGARVWCEVSGIEPHTDYLLEFAAYRPRFTNSVYLEVDIFGQRRLVNEHCTYGGIQPIFLKINSGNVRGRAFLTLENPHGEVLAFGSPSLRRAEPGQSSEWDPGSVRLPNFFPVGIFSARLGDLEDIRAAGFNAVQSYESAPALREMAVAAARLELKLLPDLRTYMADFSREMGSRPELLGFYIEDEPEIRSIAPKQVQGVKDAVKRDHPGVLTAMAMVRPQMVEAYREAADVFLLDPYPVPHMPLTWLADSLEEASRHVTRERLWAVIQAFGGGKWAKHGWDRRPTYEEMRCLAYLGLVHGARGLFFFSYQEMRSDEAAWESVKKIVWELKELHSWLVLENISAPLRLQMKSAYKADAAGDPAVHFCHKERGTEHLLILANVIDRPVSFFLEGFGPEVSFLQDCFGWRKSVVRDGNIREEMAPYEVRVYRYQQQD